MVDCRTIERYLERWVYDNVYACYDWETLANALNFHDFAEEVLSDAMDDHQALIKFKMLSPSGKTEYLIFNKEHALQIVKRELRSYTTSSWPEVDGFKSGQQGKIMMNNPLSNLGADKFMNRLFRRADGVVWDLMTGKVGISTKDGIATLTGEGDDAQIEINMVEQFGMEIPAFAQSTPIDAVAVGDVIYFGSTDKPGWVIEKKFSGGTAAKAKTRATAAVPAEPGGVVSFVLMKVDGQRTTWKPPKVSMLGMGDTGVMVLRSLMTMLPGGNAGLQGMQSMLMPMMMMGDGNMDLEKMLPLMLMGQMQAAPVANPDGSVTAAANPMAQMLPMMMMMQMMKGGESPFSTKKATNKPQWPTEDSPRFTR